MKAQAAVEFLTTYGIFILFLMIALATLFSTGILTPNYLVAEECNFGNNLQCGATVFNEGGSGRMILEVFNAFPYKVRVVEVSMQTQDGLQQFAGFDSAVEIDSGETYAFRGTLGGPALQDGAIKRFTGNITYVSCAPELGPSCSTVEHIVSGRVTSRVVPE